MTKEQIYKSQMTELGIYEPVFDPEIRTLARIERELTRAMKAWSDTAPPGGKPSFLDDRYAVIQKLRAEALQHREALGLTPKALRKLIGAAGTDAPPQKDLITEKLDRIAERVAGYDDQNPWGWDCSKGGTTSTVLPDPFEGIPAADEAAAISDMMDRQERAEDINERLAKGVGPAPRGAVCPAAHGPWYDEDYDLSAAMAEDMG